MEIRKATMEDLEQIAAVEKACFPPAEAATKASFKERLASYPDHFLLMFEGSKLIAFVDGFVTDEEDLTDEMFADASLHRKDGKWQMLFGVNTLPEYRRCGYAGQLIREMIGMAREEGRAGVVLTCKDQLVHYYAGFGFVNEGETVKSCHGGVKWNQMRLTF